jgi:hypothetical protein
VPATGDRIALCHRSWSAGHSPHRVTDRTSGGLAWAAAVLAGGAAGRLPPELNPVEPLWASLNGTGLANLVGDTLEKIIAAAERASSGSGPPRNLPFSFLRCCGLSPW